MTAKKKVESEKVTVHLVMALAIDSKAGLKRRVLQYNRVKSMLIAPESNEERDAPMGLRRIRVSELPKLGGMLGNCVAALTEAEADAALRRHLEGRQKRAQSELDAVKAALALLGEMP